jgi:ABC-type glycerol-3-phosphate transport system substrate-binding protein
MKSVHMVARAASVLFCLFVASACGSGESSTSASKADPLSEFFGTPSPEKIQAMQTKAQKKTAECMRTQGFTYLPYTSAIANVSWT